MLQPELYWIETNTRGRLAMMPRPRGGDWLEDEVSAWHRAGINVVVSLLTDEEVEDFDLQRETELCGAAGIEFISFPIEDRQVPISRRKATDLIDSLSKMLMDGKNLAIHCRQGIGRAGLIATSVLSGKGEPIEVLFDRISKVRRCPVPETAEQRKWVEEFAKAFRH